MSGFRLKVIAGAAMAFSHFGCLFWDLLSPAAVDFFYFIGRISFPVFAYLITEGWRYTKSKSQYMLRLFCFAVLSQVPYLLVVNRGKLFPFELNVLFSFFWGTCVLWLEDCALKAEKTGRRWGLFCLSLTPVFLSFFLPMDYGWKGVLCVVLMGLMKEKNKKLGILLGCVALIYLQPFSVYYGFAFLSALPALLLLYFYNGLRGRTQGKYLFYLFYPGHLAVLYCIYLAVC